MSGDTAPHVVEDLLGAVQLLSGGTVVRGDETALMSPVPFPDVPGVEWKDAVYDAARGLKVRVYRPSPALVAEASDEGNNSKLRVLVYFHGGGYCIGSYDQLGGSHHLLCRIAADLPALVLSVQYRLAPEHRLPAAIEDGATFLSWLRGQAVLAAAGDAGAEPWLAESADFSRTFLSGVSAGANLAHHLAVKAGSGQIGDLAPVHLAGMVLLSLGLSGVQRTATESDPPDGVSVTVAIADQFWRMSLPVGATFDHPLANPFGPDGPDLEHVALPPVLVEAPEVDVFRDRVLLYAAKMKQMGKDVELAEFEGEQHGFSVLRWGQANEKLTDVLLEVNLNVKRINKHSEHVRVCTMRLSRILRCKNK